MPLVSMFVAPRRSNLSVDFSLNEIQRDSESEFDFFAACNSLRLWMRRKNSKSDQKILYFKEKNSKFRLAILLPHFTI